MDGCSKLTALTTVMCVLKKPLMLQIIITVDICRKKMLGNNKRLSVSCSGFKSLVRRLESTLSVCNCFNWVFIHHFCYLMCFCYLICVICYLMHTVWVLLFFVTWNCLLLPFFVRFPLKKRSAISMGLTWLNKS